MSTRAIFARGSCRALKWIALFGVVFALGAERAAAQQQITLTGGILEIDAANSTEGGSTMVTVTLSAEVPAGDPTAAPPEVTRASTIEIVVTAASLADQTALEDLDATPAEDDDFSIAGEMNANPTATLEFDFPANATARSVGHTLTATFLLQTATSDDDAEDEGIRLTVTGVEGVVPEEGGSTTINALGGTTALGTTDADAKDIKIDDAEDQGYVLTLDPATQTPMEGDSVTVSLKADPAHVQASTLLTLNIDKAAPDYGFSIAPDATGTASVSGTNQVRIGVDTEPANASTTATITITTPANDVNRVDDTMTLSAFSGQPGAGVPEDSLPIVLTDKNMLPTITATLVDEDGTAVTDGMLAEGMTYMLTLNVVSATGTAMEAAEDLTIALTGSGSADSRDDYSLASSLIMIASGEMSSEAVNLEVDLNDDIENDTLMFSAEVAGEPDYGTETDVIPTLLSLTLVDATSKLVTVADGAMDAIYDAIDAAKGDDGMLNKDDRMIEILKSALFDAAPGHTVRVDAMSSDTAVATVYDDSPLDAETIEIHLGVLGTAMITVTGTAVPAGSTFMPTQISKDVAEIKFEVTVELAPPGPPRNLDVEVGDGNLNFTWDPPDTGGDHSGYELRLDAGDWRTQSSADAQNSNWGNLTNGVAYVFELRATNDAGKSESVSLKATPEGAPLGPQITVKSVTTVASVPESGGFEVTVVATVDAGTKGADGKVAPIASRSVAVSFPTDNASITAGDEADAGDLTVLGTRIWEKIPQSEKASEATYKFRVAVGQDLDAEDEQFQVEVSIDGASQKSKVVTIDDAQEQTYVLSLPTAAKGAIKEGAAAATLTLEADPAKTTDIPVTLVLEPNDPSKYTLSAPSSDMFGTASVTATIAAEADSDRADGTITVSAYTAGAGALTSLDIAVTDINALPAVKATLVGSDGKALSPQPESVKEGEMVKIMLTAVDKDGKAMKAAEKLTITLSPTGTADSADYSLSSQSFEIASGKESSAVVDLMVTEDQDLGAETLMFDAVVAGEAKNGTDTKLVMGVLSLMIEDGTALLVWAKTQEEVEAAIYAANHAGMGDDMTFTEGEMIEVMGSALFSAAQGVTLSYTAESDNDGVASTSTGGGTVTVTAQDMVGMAHITITAHASMPSGVMILDQSDPREASIMFPVEVGLEALTLTLSGPEDMNIAEGGMGAMVTVMANRPVTEDTMVTLMRDRSMSTADDMDFEAEPITIAAGEMMGSTMVMALEDDIMEEMEELVLYGMAADNAGEVTGEVTLYIWDAAVPALPLIAQLLLAAFLALGGYRRYLRR